MADPKTQKNSQNTWAAKLKRTFTSVLPVDKNRQGNCKRCGSCCKLPNRCAFLRFNEQGLSECAVYPFRPLNCRKYPRTKSELITADTCGFNFDSEE